MTADTRQPKNATRKRRYQSTLRDEQAEFTRSRILEAAAEQIIDRSAGQFSVERVAQRAGVAPRTIYHHFPNREALLIALDAWVESRFNTGATALPTDAAGLPGMIETVFSSFDENESFVRAQLLSGAGQEVRSLIRAQRRQALEALIKSLPAELSDAQARDATALVHHLISSETWRALKDESGLSGKEAGRAVAWALRALLSALERSESRVEEGGTGNE